MGTLVGKKAPDFQVKGVVKNTIQGDINLSQFLGKYIVLFFYPLDFTFVCPTELHAFQEKLHQFLERNAEVIACSVDSAYAHLAYLHTPREKGGIEGIEYPILSDLNKTIAQDYGVLHPSEGVAFRALFLIDTAGHVRHQLVNDLPIGRSVDEALRVLDALRFHEEHGEVCPANWQRGNPGMKATQEGLQQYVTLTLQ